MTKKRPRKRAPHRAATVSSSTTPPWAWEERSRWSRTDVANVLRVSKRTVQRLEADGILTAVVVDGAHYFDPAAVRSYRELYGKARKKLGEGELAAEVFDRFQNAKTLAEIVLELKITPRLVRALYLEWRTDLEAFAASVEQG